jgi:NitT/TauT family transport system substrate-binding protein
MDNRRPERWSRREFLGGLTLAGTAGLLGLQPGPVAAEPPPETTKIKLIKISGICIAPQYVAEELLQARGPPKCNTSGRWQGPDLRRP